MSQSLSHYSEEHQAAVAFHAMVAPKVEPGSYNSGHAGSAIAYSKPTGSGHSLMTSQQGSNVQHLQQSQVYPQINQTQAHVQQNSYSNSNQLMHPLADGSGLHQNLQQHYTASPYHNQRPALRYAYQGPCQSQQSSMSYGVHLNQFLNHPSLYLPQYQYQHQASAPNQQAQLQQQGVGCMQQSPPAYIQQFGTYPQCSPPQRSHQQIATNLTMQNQSQQPSPTSGMGWVNTSSPAATAARTNCNNFQSGTFQSGNSNGNVSAGTVSYRTSAATPTAPPQPPTPQIKSPTPGTNATMTGVITQQQPQQQLHPSRLQLNDPSTLPGGLEVLWKEVPEECKKLMTLQDIPLTATARGYFTVCELLVLKRSLEARLFGYARPPRGQSNSKGVKGEARLTRGAKRKPAGKAKAEEPVQHAPVTSSDNDNSDGIVFIKKVKYDGNMTQEENVDRSYRATIMDLAEICKTEIEELEGEDEPLINYNGTKEEIRTSTPPPVSGVGIGIGMGGAVKEAMEILTTTQFSPISNVDGDGDVEGADPGENGREEDEMKDVMKIEINSEEEPREEPNPGDNEQEQAEADAVKDDDGEQCLAIAE